MKSAGNEVPEAAGGRSYQIRQPKIAIFGAGLVGGSAALFSAVTIPSAEVVIIDTARERAEGQVLDLAHAAAFWGHHRFFAGGCESARDADIIVITAGVGVKEGQTRLDIAKTNADIAAQIASRTKEIAPNAFYVIASNPCDVVAGVVHDIVGGPRERVISTGTSLDTARLRSLLSEELGVVASAVHAYVLGEHGESALIDWSGATVMGMSVDTFLARSGKELDHDAVLRSVHNAARNIKKGKPATHYGIASGIGRICQAIVHNTDLVLSVGIVHPDIEGVPDVCLSLPMVINGSGARLLAYPELVPAEREALRRSARIVKDATDSVLSHRQENRLAA